MSEKVEKVENEETSEISIDNKEENNLCVDKDTVEGAIHVLTYLVGNYQDESIEKIQFDTEQENILNESITLIDEYINYEKSNGKINQNITYDVDKFKDLVRSVYSIIQQNSVKEGGMFYPPEDEDEDNEGAVARYTPRNTQRIKLQDLVTVIMFCCGLLFIGIAYKNLKDIFCMEGVGDLTDVIKLKIEESLKNMPTNDLELTIMLFKIGLGLTVEVANILLIAINNIIQEPGGIVEQCFGTTGEYNTIVKYAQYGITYIYAGNTVNECIRTRTTNLVDSIVTILKTKATIGYGVGIIGTGFLLNSCRRVSNRLGITQQINERLGWVDDNPRIEPPRNEPLRLENVPVIRRRTGRRRAILPPQEESNHGGFKKRKTMKTRKSKKVRKTKKVKKTRKTRKTRKTKKSKK
jgi:hypothetical protein